MTTILEIKEKLKIFYSKFDIYIIPFVRFLLGLTAFMMISSNVGFMGRLKNPVIAVVLALLCAFLPSGMIAIVAALLILAHAYALSLEVLVFAFVVIAIMFLLYFRMAPKHGYVLVLTPIAFVLKVPLVMPVMMGLVGNPITAVPVGCGTVTYYMLKYLKNNQKMLQNAEGMTMQQRITSLIDNVVMNKEMILIVIAFALTTVIVYVIRRLSVNYAWSIAIVAGLLVDLIVIIAGNMKVSTSISLPSVLLGTLGAAVIAFILQFFIFSVDYSRTEYVQFEDDEYYYYVKAVPKLSIAVPDVKVKKIAERKTVKKPATAKKAVKAKRPQKD